VTVYHISFGYAEDRLNRTLSSATNQIRLMHRNLDRWPGDQPIYLRIQAEDADGNTTAWTATHSLAPSAGTQR